MFSPPLLVWRVVLATALIVVIYGSLRSPGGIELFAGADKLIHFVTYAALYILAWLAFPGRVWRWRLHIALLTFGGLIEILQSQTGDRSMDGVDMLANAGGSGFGNLLLSFCFPLLPRSWTQHPRRE